MNTPINLKSNDNRKEVYEVNSFTFQNNAEGLTLLLTSKEKEIRYLVDFFGTTDEGDLYHCDFKTYFLISPKVTAKDEKPKLLMIET